MLAFPFYVWWVVFVLSRCLFFCRSARGMTSGFHDMVREAHNHLQVDYGGIHPFERNLQFSTQYYDERQDASRSDALYSTRDSSYYPIRIKFDTSLLQARMGESNERDAVIQDILDALPEASEQIRKHLFTVPVRSSITAEPDVCFGIFADRFQGATFHGTDIVVLVSGQNTLLEEDGVNSFSVCGESTLALGTACSLDQYDRPVIGFINFCLDYQPSSTSAYLQSIYSHFLEMDLLDDHVKIPKKAIAVHEMVHVLGFSSWLFKYFRQSDGTPRTSRPFKVESYECVDDETRSGVLPSAETIRSTTDMATGKRSYHIVTPRVTQVARNLLHCEALTGARLGDGNDCFGSHWHERLFLGELMSSMLTSSSENVLSPLTLALLEDSGWYRVNYRDVKLPVYGLSGGCDFATESCIQNDMVPEWGRNMFCSSPISFNEAGRLSLRSLNHVICDPSHRWWTLCDLWNAPTVPEGVAIFPESTESYFSNENLVTSFYDADSCPIAVRSLGYDCTQYNPDYVPFYPGETVGSSSRCLVTSFERPNGGITFRPACMATRCDASLGKVVVLLNGSAEQVCQNDGDVLTLSDGSLVECPRLSSVCPHLATCPGGCSGRGVCNYNASPPTCICNAGEKQNEGCYPDVNPPVENLPQKEENPPTPIYHVPIAPAHTPQIPSGNVQPPVNESFPENDIDMEQYSGARSTFPMLSFSPCTVALVAISFLIIL